MLREVRAVAWLSRANRHRAQAMGVACSIAISLGCKQAGRWGCTRFGRPVEVYTCIASTCGHFSVNLNSQRFLSEGTS